MNPQLQGRVDWYLKSHVTAPAAEKLIRDLVAEIERLTAPITDEERGALATSIRQHALMTNIFGTVDPRELADAILAAGFRRRGPITDALSLLQSPEYYEAKPHKAHADLERVRAALEAAKS